MMSHPLVTTFSRAHADEYGLQADAEIATRSSRLYRGLRPGDRPLRDGEEPALAAHLVTPRLGFAHHGIYVGCGSVVHYGAFVHGLQRGPVEEVSLERFIYGHSLWVRTGVTSFHGDEVIQRARSRLGENSYCLLSNNCEHFCEWCLRGEPRSEQVERALAVPRVLARSISAAAAGIACRLRRFDPLELTSAVYPLRLPR